MLEDELDDADPVCRFKVKEDNGTSTGQRANYGSTYIQLRGII